MVTLHHTGIAVSDLRRSIEFYHRMFGVAPDTERGMIDDGGRHGVTQAVYALAQIPLPGGRLELLEYRVPDDASKEPVHNYCAVGSAHIAMSVSDLDALREDLTAKGMRFLGTTMSVESGPAAGLKIACGLDPDGNRIEFIQTPQEV